MRANLTDSYGALPLRPPFSGCHGGVMSGSMQWFVHRSRGFFDASRSLFRSARAKWWLGIVFQRQLQRSCIVLSAKLTSDAKAEVNSRRDSARGNAIAILHHTADD